MSTTRARHRRLNITLPVQTVRLLDRVAPRGSRSSVIDEAVRFYVAHERRATLRKRLRDGALVRAERDLSIANDWAALEDFT